MDQKVLIDGLLMFLGLIVLLTFHEFGHAWVAWKCGDDTARLQGRVSLNPAVHIDPLGTLVLPLVMVVLQSFGHDLSGILLGWARPVPVNTHNLRRPSVDDLLVTLAGPGMNLLVGIVLIAGARLGYAIASPGLIEVTEKMAFASLALCFFNMLPIPPLDGSRVLRNLTGMSYETYNQFAQYGFFLLMIAINLRFVQIILGVATGATYGLIATVFGLPSFY
jgi:Zn-dependent protease